MVAVAEVLDPMVLGSRVCPVQVCEPCPSDMHVGVGCRKGSPYAAISGVILI